MKERINSAIEYLKSVSFECPRDIRVEEIEDGGPIVLSYEIVGQYRWETQRVYKKFTFRGRTPESSIESMAVFVAP